jgi:hypothetical protein
MRTTEKSCCDERKFVGGKKMGTKINISVYVEVGIDYMLQKGGKYREYIHDLMVIGNSTNLIGKLKSVNFGKTTILIFSIINLVSQNQVRGLN